MEKHIHTFKDLTLQKNMRFTVFCRLLRTWTVIKNDDQVSKQFIFIDEEGQKIQGWTNKSWIKKFEHLIEDRTYSISNFGVNPNTPTTYTYSQLPHKLAFFMTTKVEEFEGLAIPHNSYDLVEFDKIIGDSLDCNYLVDVIGKLKAIGDIIQVEVNGDINNVHPKIEINLQNLRGDTIRCTFWDQYAEQFKEYVNASSKEIVVIIQYAKINKFRGDIKLVNSIGGTRIFIEDITIPEILEFKNSDRGRQPTEEGIGKVFATLSEN